MGEWLEWWPTTTPKNGFILEQPNGETVLNNFTFCNECSFSSFEICGNKARRPVVYRAPFFKCWQLAGGHQSPDEARCEGSFSGRDRRQRGIRLREIRPLLNRHENRRRNLYLQNRWFHGSHRERGRRGSRSCRSHGRC